MSTDGTEPRAALREAMRRQERNCANGVPSFARIAARIEDEPSVFEAPAWSVRRSARLAASLAAVQVRVMPRAVLPAALAMAALATVAACFVASGWGAEGAAWWFSALLLLGAALTVCAALSSDKADVLALAMPLGPQTVLLARLATVLGVDALAGLAASAAFAWWGAPMELGMLVSSWLVPLAAVAGASALVAVWANASWAGAVAGAVLVPLVVPAGRAAADGGTLNRMVWRSYWLQSSFNYETMQSGGWLFAMAVSYTHLCFDNEEVGSETKQGAASTLLADTLSRVNAALGLSLIHI